MEERSATIQNLENHARHIRETMLDMAYGCGYNSHLGGGLSCVEALTVLYGDIMNVTDKGVPENSRDKFILSKGHGALGYYAAMHQLGMITDEQFASFEVRSIEHFNFFTYPKRKHLKTQVSNV